MRGSLIGIGTDMGKFFPHYRFQAPSGRRLLLHPAMKEGRLEPLLHFLESTA